MNKTTISLLAGLGLVLASGCGGGGSGDSSADGLTSLTGIGETGNTDTAEGNSGDQNGDGDGDTGPGDGDGDTGPGDGDGDPGDGDGDTSGNNQKWDTLSIPDASEACPGSDGEFEFSFLWAANSSQGTISKIDTATVTEVGRFQVRPDGSGSPSRTSVSLSGHVAVASRSGGVTKIYADEQFCQESNGMPGIQTSNNNQALPWGTEECVAWHVPMNYQSQRPVAWGAGELNGACTYSNEEVWTSGTNNNGTIDIYVLDGEDGSTKEMISVPTGGNGLTASFYGIYGGAVDGDGNFWGSQLGNGGRLIRVNRNDMSYDIWSTPAGPHWYGMTVDSEGLVWLCSNTVGRFDPQTETWQTNVVGGYTGCMADAGEDGLLWMSTPGNGVVGVNRDTLMVEKMWAAGGSYGISIDFEGYVWAVASGSTASKIDPETGQFWTYNGLIGAYTYSDMTGYALSNVGTPSG
jgi:streptogramin lyase